MSFLTSNKVPTIGYGKVKQALDNLIDNYVYQSIEKFKPFFPV